MGIPGIYQEIDPSRRIALLRLALENFERTGKLLRIAIDTSIWAVQVQATLGGTSSALRTLYYRLLRLLSVSVRPLFVFDGANKPPMKRNKPTARGEEFIIHTMFKQLLNYFGFSYHVAPGEAEAECALLQRKGIVDAVLSEDVDTLVFGCGLTLRNWSSESSKGKVPTHVDVYDSQDIKNSDSKLDPEGMILVALLSGGDYDTNGVTGFGIKLACQAARAGFGMSLCRISKTDTEGYAEWRERFNHEVQTNESKHFKSKHKSLKLLGSFPQLDILEYYKHPTVSDVLELAKLKDELMWERGIDVVGLRQFVAGAFGWRGKEGATKFIRGLAPVLLVHTLRLRGVRRASGHDNSILTASDELELVKSICGKREHFTTDGLPEMRIIFHPNDVVGLDMEAEQDVTCDYGQDGLAPLLEDDQARSTSLNKRPTSAYDPTNPERVWIAQTIVTLGVPLMVEDYEESWRTSRKLIRQKTKDNQAMKKEIISRKPTARREINAEA